MIYFGFVSGGFFPEKWEDKTRLPYFQSLRPYSISLKASEFKEQTWCTCRELAVVHLPMVASHFAGFLAHHFKLVVTMVW